jgi:hypothetical protein
VQRASVLFWRRLRAGATYGGAVIGKLLLDHRGTIALDLLGC